MKTESFLARRTPSLETYNVLDDATALIVLKDVPGPEGMPLMHTPWRLCLNGRQIAQGETDERGRVNVLQRLHPGKTYELEYPGRVLKMRKMTLEGIETVTGMQQRLAALGYNPGPADGDAGSRTRTALIEFQIDYDLKADGVYGELSQAKLLETFGE